MSKVTIRIPDTTEMGKTYNIKKLYDDTKAIYDAAVNKKSNIVKITSSIRIKKERRQFAIISRKPDIIISITMSSLNERKSPDEEPVKAFHWDMVAGSNWGNSKLRYRSNSESISEKSFTNAIFDDDIIDEFKSVIETISERRNLI